MKFISICHISFQTWVLRQNQEFQLILGFPSEATTTIRCTPLMTKPRWLNFNPTQDCRNLPEVNASVSKHQTRIVFHRSSQEQMRGTTPPNHKHLPHLLSRSFCCISGQGGVRDITDELSNAQPVRGDLSTLAKSSREASY